MPEDVAASWWAGMQAAPLFGRPSPGAGYDLRIDLGCEVIGSGLYWNHSLATVGTFSGAGPGPLPTAGPPACAAGWRGRNSGARRGAAGNRIARMMWWRQPSYPSRRLPARRPSVGPARRNPPAAIGSRPARGTVRHPLGGLPADISADRAPCRHPAESSEGAGPENSSATPLGGLFFNPGFRESAPRKTCVPRKTLDAVGPGNGSPPPRRAVPLQSRPGCRIPTCRPRVLRTRSGATASLISIGRQRVPIHRGAIIARSCRRFEQWRVQYSGGGEFGTPSPPRAWEEARLTLDVG